MIRRPPRSTLFPYTTSSDLNVSEATIKAHVTAILRKLGVTNRTQAVLMAGKLARSEEHTSELQSQSNLVCRLLLEKKKKPRETRQSYNRAQHKSIDNNNVHT